MGRLGSGGVVGRFGLRVGVTASYNYFRVSRKITTFVIREKKFTEKSDYHFLFREFSRKIWSTVKTAIDQMTTPALVEKFTTQQRLVNFFASWVV